MTKFKTLGKETKEKKKTTFVYQVVRGLGDPRLVELSNPEDSIKEWEQITLIDKAGGALYDTFLAESGSHSCLYLGHAGYEFD